jgi:hypothetical protein
LELHQLADCFVEAKELMTPLLAQRTEADGDPYDILERTGLTKRGEEIDQRADALDDLEPGESVIYKAWIRYTRKYPERVSALEHEELSLPVPSLRRPQQHNRPPHKTAPRSTPSRHFGSQFECGVREQSYSVSQPSIDRQSTLSQERCPVDLKAMDFSKNPDFQHRTGNPDIVRRRIAFFTSILDKHSYGLTSEDAQHGSFEHISSRHREPSRHARGVIDKDKVVRHLNVRVALNRSECFRTFDGGWIE